MKNAKNHNKIFKTIIWILFSLYFLLLIKVILFKYPMAIETLKEGNMDMFKKRIFYGSNFIPFKTIIEYLRVDLTFRISISNIVGNIIAFMPLGFLLPFLKNNVKSLKKIFKVSFITSLTFEIIQLITGLGSLDVDDIILNVLGGVIGFGLYKVFIKIINYRIQVNRDSN